MGWDSELHVDRDLAGIWRKHAPSLPTLLFRASDLVIEPAEGDDELVGVSYCTTAAGALDNLKQSGFSWDQLLQDYEDSRHFSIEVAWRQGMLNAQLSKGDYDALINEFRAVTATEDLALLASSVRGEMKALSTAWQRLAMMDSHEPDPQTPLRDLLLFTGELAPDRLPPADGASDDLTRLVQTRAIDYFVRNSRAAPMVGWAFAFVQLLKHTSPDAPVVFNISGGLPESSSCEDATQYALDFWRDARESLAATAHFYGGVFSALQGATTDVARAARYGRLEALLRDVDDTSATKAVKGRRLEDLLVALVELPDTGLVLLEKRLKHASEELDLVLRNDLDEAFWRNFRSPIFIIECKNWSKKVGVNELRILETKMQDRRGMCSVGIFVSLQGFSSPFMQRARALQASHLTVFPVTVDDLREITSKRQTLPRWLSENGLRRIV